MTDKIKLHDDCFMRETCLQEDICPLALTYNLLSGKRKIIILWFLSNRILRFSEIQKKMPDITKKMLTKQLRDLESDHLIMRHVYPTVPPKVEYEITEIGKKFIPVMEMMHHFGASYIEEYRDEIEQKRPSKDTKDICKEETDF